MRVVSCMLVLSLLCLSGTGCSLFKKNHNGGAAGAPGSGGMPPPKFPGTQDPLLNSTIPTPPAFPASTSNPASNPMTIQTAAASKDTTILAGTVIDAYHRPIGNAYIRPVNLEEKESGAPIDVVADASGHFIIQGVKPGASYKLIARTKLGEKMLAGTVFTSAPNVRVLIPIREDQASASTPPLPGAPGVPQNTSMNNDPNPFGTAWNAGQAAKANEPNLPATMNVPAPTSTSVGNPPSTSGNPTYVPGIVENPLDKDRLPMLNIPGNRPGPIPPANLPQDPPRSPGLIPSEVKLDTGPTRVPSCVLVGSHLENLALRDTKGQVWEYRKQGTGKLILLDFWGTYCLYCRNAMPILNRMQSQYGARGLEVIGIALEAGKDERKEAEAVSKLCSSMQLTYRQLLGRAGGFDAGKSFKIEGVPTLILLNEQGDIIWHHMGRPDPALLNALERTIQARLNNRAS